MSSRAEQISRRLKLRHLNVLLAVVEQRSMVKAAERLAVSQPVVSKAMADLERIVGVRLLDRGPRGMEPTLHGRALLRRSASLLDGLEAAIRELESLSDPHAGEVRIGTTEAMGTTLVPAIVNRMARQYPRISFEIILADMATLRDRDLREGRVDLIVGPFALDPTGDLDVVSLYRDRVCIVAGATSRLARRRKIALAELANERWVLPAPDHPACRILMQAFRRAGCQPPASVVRVTSAGLTSRLISDGQFIGVLAVGYLQFSAAPSSLKILRVELAASPWPVSIATLRKGSANHAAKLFVDCAHEVVAPLVSGRASHRSSRRS